VTLNGQLAASSPAEALKARLDEPQVAAALNSLLDHADLLAIVAVESPATTSPTTAAIARCLVTMVPPSTRGTLRR